jgi:maltose alpha-D-glucosyltransferase/alpha-amylase
VSARISGTDGEPRISVEAREAVAAGDLEPPPFFAALQGWYLVASSVLGRRTAEMHLTLARVPWPDFIPRPLDAAALEAWVHDAVSQATRALDLLLKKQDELPESVRATASMVLDSRDALFDRLEAARSLRDAGERIRVHGDYHLGQVLRTEEDFVILDFEGEPGRSLAERRALYSPLKDVAGMLRSFDYAAQAALVAFAQTAPGASEPLAPWAGAWRHWVSQAFLDAYRRTMEGSPTLPGGTSFDALLHALTVDKALYELVYELNSRPEWARIPLQALATLALPLQRASHTDLIIAAGRDANAPRS